MLIVLFSVVSFILGGLGRRACGGVLNEWAKALGWIPENGRVTGDYPTRALFGLTVAAGAWLGAALWWHGLALIGAIFLGCAVPLFGGLGLGRGSDSYWESFGALTLHGVGGTALAAIGAGLLGYPQWGLFFLAGLLCAPAYEIGYRVYSVGQSWLPVGFRGGPQVGEFVWGGWVALAALFCALGGDQGGTALQVLLSAAITFFHTLVG